MLPVEYVVSNFLASLRFMVDTKLATYFLTFIVFPTFFLNFLIFVFLFVYFLWFDRYFYCDPYLLFNFLI